MRAVWPAFQDELFKCIVGLCWSDVRSVPKPGATLGAAFDPSPHIASGCLLSLYGSWYFLTAGHVLNEISGAEAAGRTALRFELMAGFHRSDYRAERQPFPFDLGKCLAIDECGGRDFGLIAIPRIIRDNLVRAGSRAVAVEQVARAGQWFHGFALVGFPKQEFQVKHIDSAHARDMYLNIGTPMLPVRQEARPGFRVDRRHSPFIGRIVSLRGTYPDGRTATLSSIAG